MNTSETQQRPTRPENRTYRDREPELQRLITNTLSTVLKLGAIPIDAAMNPGGDIAEAQYYVQELVQEIRYLLDDGMLDALDRYDRAAAYKEQQEREKQPAASRERELTPEETIDYYKTYAEVMRKIYS